MFNQRFTITDVITMIFTTAMSAGGFYLLTYIMCLLITSPLGLLIGLILLNVANFAYHLSSLYVRVYMWTRGKVSQALKYLSQQTWFIVTTMQIKIAVGMVSFQITKIKNTIKKLFSKKSTTANFIQSVNAEFVR